MRVRSQSLLAAAIATVAVSVPAATIGLTPAMTAPAAASSSVLRAPLASGAPNYFWRNCSYFSGRCTSYHLSNPPYNPKVPSIYRTKWVWAWI